MTIKKYHTGNAKYLMPFHAYLKEKFASSSFFDKVTEVRNTYLKPLLASLNSFNKERKEWTRSAKGRLLTAQR